MAGIWADPPDEEPPRRWFAWANTTTRAVIIAFALTGIAVATQGILERLERPERTVALAFLESAFRGEQARAVAFTQPGVGFLNDPANLATLVAPFVAQAGDLGAVQLLDERWLEAPGVGGEAAYCVVGADRIITGRVELVAGAEGEPRVAFFSRLFAPEPPQGCVR